MNQWTKAKAREFSTPQLGKELLRKPLVRDLMGALNGKKLLEIGCGNGYWCHEFAQRGAQVTGIDVSDEQLQFAEAAEAQQPLGIRYLKRNGAQLTDVAAGEFDWVFLDYVLLEVGEVEILKGIFTEAYRVLTAGGQLLVSELHPFDPLLDDEVTLPPAFDYFKRGVPFTARGRQIDKTTIEYTDYHWTVSDYFEAMTAAGFRVARLLEPQVSSSVLQSHPELRYRAHLPRDIVFVAQK